ncbi:MAG: MotA/TolQ/ExbB proton channel family protein [Desulfobacterales bacterium]|nr:MotA/TolQ/ExbB proton channel family protein [Desulfobacterales bacterium]
MDKVTRPVMAVISVIVGIIVILILTIVLPSIGEKTAKIILDYPSGTYPFTIQNFMLLLFFIGLGELVLRWRDANAETAYIKRSYLPDDTKDDRTVLQAQDMGPIRQDILKDIKKDGAFLPNMINRCILQFQASKSTGETNGVLNSMVEVYFHQIDLKYTILRYISWAIPTIGFIGTVVGIASSLDVIGQNPDNINLVKLTSLLGIAFNTTLVALVLSAFLVFFIHIVQEKEERSLNKSMEYCLINFINRLYTSD